MKLLIVDDSIVYRSAIRKAAEGLSGISSIEVASNGKVALDFVKAKKIDFITLDLEMPIMDGLDFLKEVRKINRDIIIVVFASESLGEVNKAIVALEMGANDFIPKKSDAKDIEESVYLIKNELAKRVEAFGKINTSESASNSIAKRKDFRAQTQNADRLELLKNFHPHAICFGSSTGGPDLWRRIFKDLSDFKLSKPCFLVQHMPPLFTKQFASMLNNLVPFEVREAIDGEEVRSGVFYIAPGDYHMRLQKKSGKTMISLDQEEKNCFVRPAVNCLLDSAYQIYGNHFLTVILTGMGDDGLSAVRKLYSNMVPIFIQDKESSSVWGMPGAIAEEGLYDQMIKDTEIASFIRRFGVL